MADDLILRCSNLRLEEGEGDIVDLGDVVPDNQNDNLELLLIGKLLTDRPFNVDAFKRTMTKVWAPSQGMVIRVLGPNLFAFQLFHWRDLERIMSGRPWCFENMLIVLKQVEGDEQPEEVTLSHSPFWVRVKNLPFNCRSNAHVKALIEGMGEVLEFEEDAWGLDRYRRVKIMLDVSRPLRRLKVSKDRRGREVVVEFSYERLPFFCFACGVMGHSERDCDVVSEDEKKKGLGWGMFLRASPRKGRGKEMEEMESVVACRKTLFVTKKEDPSKESMLRTEVRKSTLVAASPIDATNQNRTRSVSQNSGEKVVVEGLVEIENGGVVKQNVGDGEVGGVGEVEGTVSLPGEVEGDSTLLKSPAMVFTVRVGDEKKVGGKVWKRRVRDPGNRGTSRQDGGGFDVDLGKRGRFPDCEMVDVEGATKKVVVSSEFNGLRLAEAALEQSRQAR